MATDILATDIFATDILTDILTINIFANTLTDLVAEKQQIFAVKMTAVNKVLSWFEGQQIILRGDGMFITLLHGHTHPRTCKLLEALLEAY